MRRHRDHEAGRKTEDTERLRRWHLGVVMGRHPVAAAGTAVLTAAVCAAFGTISGAGFAVAMAALGAAVGALLGAQIAESAGDAGMLQHRHR